MQVPPITIEQVAQQFKAWRQNKTNKFDPIPKHLKELVQQLFHHHSTQDIVKRLNTNQAIISSIKKAYEASLNTSPTSTSNKELENINFVPFQLVNSTDNSFNHEISSKQGYYTCHIIKPNGTKLIIQTPDPSSVIQAFLCCN